MRKFFATTILTLLTGLVLFIWLSEPKAIGSTQNESLAIGTENCKVAHWTFDLNDYIKVSTTASSTIRDITGRGNDGIASLATKPVPGVLGQGFSFNGNADPANQSYIELGDRNDLEVTSTWGISVWAKWDTVSSATRFIYRYSGNFGYRIYPGADSTSMVCSFHPANGSLPSVTSTSGLNDGEWHHHFCVYDGNQMKMWTDGVVAYGDVTSTVPFYETDNGTIGRGANETSRPFQGQLDDVRIYNCAPSTSTVLETYSEGLSAFNVNLGATYNANNTFVSGDKAGWWSFDGPTVNVTTTAGVSSIMLDMSGNGNYMNMATSSVPTSPTYPVFVSGAIGQGGNFNNSNYWQTNPLASSSPLLVTTGTISVSFWAKFTDISSVQVFVRCSNNFGWRFRKQASGQVQFNFFDSSSVLYTATSPNILNDGKWHHYVGVYDRANVLIYVDTTLTVGSSTSNANIHYVLNQCAIGHNPSETAFPYTGQMDELQVYNRALTSTEINVLYNAGI